MPQFICLFFVFYQKIRCFESLGRIWGLRLKRGQTYSSFCARGVKGNESLTRRTRNPTDVRSRVTEPQNSEGGAVREMSPNGFERCAAPIRLVMSIRLIASPSRGLTLGIIHQCFTENFVDYFQELQSSKSQKDSETLMSALEAMQDKNLMLENSLSSETRLKLDLFSALGEVKRQLELANCECSTWEWLFRVCSTRATFNVNEQLTAQLTAHDFLPIPSITRGFLFGRDAYNNQENIILRKLKPLLMTSLPVAYNDVTSWSLLMT